jgi:hypothetical protein
MLPLTPISPLLNPTRIRERGVYVDVLTFEVKRFRHCITPPPNCRIFSIRRHCEKLESRPLLGMRDFDIFAAMLRCFPLN